MRHLGPWLLACVVVGAIVLVITGHEDALYHIAGGVGLLVVLIIFLLAL